MLILDYIDTVTQDVRQNRMEELYCQFDQSFNNADKTSDVKLFHITGNNKIAIQKEDILHQFKIRSTHTHTYSQLD